ncbi:MAG: hypothetical protein KF744_08415 [Taibaiella sp.]|nr:hypothetical protein [Taibaiella sp.]
MAKQFSFLIPISCLLAASQQPTLPPGNWAQLKGIGIEGKVQTLREVTLQKMTVPHGAEYEYKWDTVSLSQYTFDNRGNLLSWSLKKRRSRERLNPHTDHYSHLVTYVDDSSTFDKFNRLIGSRRWVEEGYATANWIYGESTGIHTTGYNGKNSDTERISLITDGTLQLAEYRDISGCLTKRIFTDTDFDSTVLYKDCGKGTRAITTYQKSMTDSIVGIRRMDYSNGMSSGSTVRTYKDRKLEETIIDHTGNVSERTIYTYDKQGYLSEEAIFDRRDKQLKKVTYAYDSRGHRISECLYGTDPKMYEWKKDYHYDFDELLRVTKQVIGTSYPRTHYDTPPYVTKLFRNRDGHNNVLEELTIIGPENEADTAIITRQITYFEK